MGDVTVLAPQERTPMDLDRLMAMGGPPGDMAARTALDDRLEDLAAALSRLSVGFRKNDMDRVASASRDAADISRALGLNRAFRVGRATAKLSQGSDGVALAANVARLIRLGDQALSMVWHLRDSHSER